MSTASGDEGDREARVDVVHAGHLLQGGVGAALLLLCSIIVVHHQLLHLHEALDDGHHPEVHLRHLDIGTKAVMDHELCASSEDSQCSRCRAIEKSIEITLLFIHFFSLSTC